VVDGVGRALTGKFQQVQDSVAIGTTLHSEAVVLVRWEWIAYPLALTLLGLAGLLLTILSTHNRHMAVWKESTLPLLFRYTGATAADSTEPHTQKHLHHDNHDDDTFHGSDARPPRTTTALTLSATPPPESNRVSSIINQAAGEQVQLLRRDSFWVLDPTTSTSTPTSRPPIITEGADHTTSASRLVPSSSEDLSHSGPGFPMQDLQLEFEPPPREFSRDHGRERWV
jgi:hypothetical protein